MNPSKKQLWKIAGLVVAVLVVISIFQTLRFFRESKDLRLHTISLRQSPWQCTSGYANGIGDTVTTCVDEQDTLVELAMAWFKLVELEHITSSQATVTVDKRNTIEFCGVKNGIRLTNSTTPTEDYKTLIIHCEILQPILGEGNSKVYSFYGDEIAFSADGTTLFTAVRFGKRRRGCLVAFEKPGGIMFRLEL